ncbi:MAG: YfaZ family outer membrane protein [Arcobacteraceae bacterium]
MKKIILGSLVTGSLLLANNSAQVNVNKDTLELAADIYLNKYYNTNNSSNYYITAGYLRTEGEKNNDDQSLTSVGFKLINPMTNNYGISLGMGIKTVYTTHEAESFLAMPLTLNGRIEFNEMIYFDANVSYSPRVLSFMDAESYRDIQARINYKVLADGYIYLGGRNIETEYENNTRVKFDTSAFVGFEIRF